MADNGTHARLTRPPELAAHPLTTASHDALISLELALSACERLSSDLVRLMHTLHAFGQPRTLTAAPKVPPRTEVHRDDPRDPE